MFIFIQKYNLLAYQDILSTKHGIYNFTLNQLPACGFNQCFYDQQARSDHVQDTFKKTHSKYRSHWRAIGSDDRKH